MFAPCTLCVACVRSRLARAKADERHLTCGGRAYDKVNFNTSFHDALMHDTSNLETVNTETVNIETLNFAFKGHFVHAPRPPHPGGRPPHLGGSPPPAPLTRGAAPLTWGGRRPPLPACSPAPSL